MVYIINKNVRTTNYENMYNFFMKFLSRERIIAKLVRVQIYSLMVSFFGSIYLRFVEKVVSGQCDRID